MTRPAETLRGEVLTDVSREDTTVYTDDERPETRVAGWRLESIEDADWALARIQDLNMERAEIEAQLQARMQELKARADVLVERVNRGVRFFEGHLRSYAETHRDVLLKGGKRKSRELLHGSIGWCKAGGRARKVDEAALLAWAQQQPAESGFLRIREEPSWEDIKRHVEQTGEDVPGVEIEPEREEFTVKTGGK